MADTAIVDLPSEATLTYNGVTFGPLVRYRLRGTPQYDPARRSVMCVHYVLSVVSFWPEDNDSASDTTIGTLKSKLLTPGKRLTISDIGWGTAGQDIIWGPHPLNVQFTPIGGAICWQVDWECEFKVAPCSSTFLGTPGSRNLMASNYDVSYSNDERGFSTRTISGVVVFPQIADNGKVKDTPENYRYKINVPVPSGYERVRSDWRSNAAQNQLAYTIVDAQRKTDAPPVGISAIELDFAIQSQELMSNVNYDFVVNGTLESLPGWPKQYAAIQFFRIVYSKLLAMARVMNASKTSFIPQRLVMRHAPFTRRSSFQMTWHIAGAPAHSIYQPAVLYSKMPDSNYTTWATSTFNNVSLVGSLWLNQGQSTLGTESPDVVDICNTSQFVTLNSTGGIQVPLSADFATPAELFNSPLVTPESSWLHYDAEISLHRIENVKVSKRDAYINLRVTGRDPAQSLANSFNGKMALPSFSDDDAVTHAGVPEQRLIHRGKAVRVKFPVDIPQLVAIEGVGLTFMGVKKDDKRQPLPFGGGDMNCCRWISVYRPNGPLTGEMLKLPHPKIDVHQRPLG